MILDFSTYQFGYNLNIPNASNIISITDSNVSLALGGAKFSDNHAIITGAALCVCPNTAWGILANGTAAEDSLFGSDAKRAGLQFGVQVSGAGLPGGGNLFGGLVATKLQVLLINWIID